MLHLIVLFNLYGSSSCTLGLRIPVITMGERALREESWIPGLALAVIHSTSLSKTWESWALLVGNPSTDQ